MLFRIKIRLWELGKRQKDLIPELEKLGIRATPAELSNAINDIDKGPKASQIVSLANQIVTAWEKEKECKKADI